MINFSVCTQRISCLSQADRYFKRCISWTDYPMRAGFLTFSAESLLLLYMLNSFWLVKNWLQTNWKQSLSHFVSVFSPHTVRESINIMYKSLAIGLLIWIYRKYMWIGVVYLNGIWAYNFSIGSMKRRYRVSPTMHNAFMLFWINLP